MKNRGQWLMDLLDAAEWTPAQLSEKTGIDSAVISNIRNGKRGVGTNVARKIAAALKIPVEEVYQEAGLLPKPKTKDRWVRRIEHKLEQITDEDDRRTVEGIIDLLAPEKKARAGRRLNKNDTS